MPTAHPRSSPELPCGDAPEPVTFDHFPSRLHAFIFRNWHAVDPTRLAKVLRTNVARVSHVAASMGLGSPKPFEPRHAKRGYITVLRRNWHLLSYDQLLELLGMTAEELSLALREDDFLWHKMGLLKPQCPPLKYMPPTLEETAGAERIRRDVGDLLTGEGSSQVPRFAFLDDLR